MEDCALGLIFVLLSACSCLDYYSLRFPVFFSFLVMIEFCLGLFMMLIFSVHDISAAKPFKLRKRNSHCGKRDNVSRCCLFLILGKTIYMVVAFRLFS